MCNNFSCVITFHVFISRMASFGCFWVVFEMGSRKIYILPFFFFPYKTAAFDKRLFPLLDLEEFLCPQLGNLDVYEYDIQTGGLNCMIS